MENPRFQPGSTPQDRCRMKSIFEQEMSDGPSTLAGGIADLMTSLAVIFVLLLAAYITRAEDGNAKPPSPMSHATAEREVPLQPHHLTVERSSADPDVMRVVIPTAILNFELGKSTLLPRAEAFLADTIPYYAAMICGPQGHEVESFVIEGYTDDQGD